jgi:hypothetical protein
VKLRLSSEDLKILLDVRTEDFPKYVWPLINLANKFSQGTRPRVVGQMSDLIQEFAGSTLEEWRDWYNETRPASIDQATEKILAQLQALRVAIATVDRPMVKRWVEDLVIVKTFIGLKFQQAILRFIAEHRDVEYRLANAEEESRGIDGFVGDKPVCIKPDTYRTKRGELQETLPEDAELVYCRKLEAGKGIEIEFSDT